MIINKAREGFSKMVDIMNENVNVNTFEGAWEKFREYQHRYHSEHHHHVFYACNHYMYDINHSNYFNLIKMPIHS